MVVLLCCRDCVSRASAGMETSGTGWQVWGKKQKSILILDGSAWSFIKEPGSAAVHVLVVLGDQAFLWELPPTHHECEGPCNTSLNRKGRWWRCVDR